MYAAAALGAALLDACLPGLLSPLRAVELAAAAGLVAACIVRRNEGLCAWRTAFDGRIAGALAVLLLAAAPWRPGGAGAGNLRLVFTGTAILYAQVALVGRDARALEGAWRAFPLAAGLLGLHALWAAAPGPAHLGVAAAAADVRWGGPHALDSALVVASVLAAGRAAEPGGRPAWRLAAIVGGAGVLLHAAAVGAPFTASALGRLEDPLQFSATMVVALVLQRLGRIAWSLRHERPSEKARWWGAVAAVAVLGAELLYGTGPAGEGVVVLAALLGAIVATAPGVRAEAAPALPAEPAAPFARAA